MRRRTLLKTSGSGGGIEPSMSAAADVCLYEKSSDSLIIVPGNQFSKSAYPSSNYSPVGVVVVPGSHNVYGTGECGVMSLKTMSCTTPTTGSNSNTNNSSTNSVYMYWGVYGTDISELANMNVVCQVGNNGTVNETVQGTTSNAYLPSDKFSTVANPYDTDTSYYYNDSDYYIPSPYNNDESRNPAYYQTSSPSSTANAMSDFDGVGNTDVILAARGTKDYSSWTPTYNTQADYPPASCCDMFYTDGTSQGDWYLPACGELGYIMPKFNAINTSIAALIDAYGDSVGVQLDSSYGYWSSTEYSSYGARYVGTNSGRVSYGTKNGSYYVRAWLRVGA